MTEFEKQDQEVMDLVNGMRRENPSVTADAATLPEGELPRCRGNGRVALRCQWQIQQSISVCRGRQVTQLHRQQGNCRAPQTELPRGGGTARRPFPTNGPSGTPVPTAPRNDTAGQERPAWAVTQGSQERILRRGAPRNDTENGRGDTSSVTCGDTYQQGYACPRQASESGIRCAEHHSSRRRLEQRKCENARRQLWLILKIFICALVAVLFVAALLDPNMVPAVVNMGVLSCGCVAVVSIDRYFRRRC